MKRRQFDELAPPADTENPAPADTSMCAANGCPLRGVFTDSTTGSDSWYCQCHYNCAEPANVTRRVRVRAEEFKSLFRAKPTAENLAMLHHLIRTCRGELVPKSKEKDAPVDNWTPAANFYAPVDNL
jgi:hypothetical protein